jgi:ribosome maturation factor RimP
MPPGGRATGRSGRPGAGRSAPAGPVTGSRAGHTATGGPTSGDVAAHRARLRAIVEPVAAKSGCDLEELALVRMGRRYVVRVLVDRDGGIGLDAIADLARDISTALDDAEAAEGEFIAGEYQLEVSSPGVDRPLTEPRHWRRNIGRLVRVPVAGTSTLARVTAADESGVTLEIEDRTRTVRFADLGPGRVEVEFHRLELDGDDLDEDLDEDLTAFDEDSDPDEEDAP